MKFPLSTLCLICLLYLTIFTFGAEGYEVNEDNINAAKNSTKSGNAVSFAFCTFPHLCNVYQVRNSANSWCANQISNQFLLKIAIFNYLQLAHTIVITEKGLTRLIVIGAVIGVIVVLAVIVSICACFKSGRECVSCICDFCAVCEEIVDEIDEELELS